MLEHREETDAIARERKAFRKRQEAFAAMNSHAIAGRDGIPTLSPSEAGMASVDEFNAAHEEWLTAKAEVERILEEIRSGKRP
jgi:hypothetical protein